MKMSEQGILLIKRFEGCRLTAYRCAAGKPTIGYGHTKGVRMGQTVTQAQAEAFLKADLIRYEKNVEKYRERYHWNQNEFDALVSFAFNIGSIDRLTDFGTRSRKIIAEKMLQYNRAAGSVLPGLTERRKAECKLFLMPMEKKVGSDSAASSHVQINYQAGQQYRVTAEGLRVRTKKASQDPLRLPNAPVIGIMEKGVKVMSFATAQVGESIWMYIGTGSGNLERWICADTGSRAYVQ